MKNYIKYLPFLAIGLLSCEPEFDDAIEENEEIIIKGYEKLHKIFTVSGYRASVL